MNFIEEYEQEVAAKAAAEIAAEDAAWNALTPEEKQARIAAEVERCEAEELRQAEIARRHEALFGADEDEEDEEED